MIDVKVMISLIFFLIKRNLLKASVDISEKFANNMFIALLTLKL